MTARFAIVQVWRRETCHPTPARASAIGKTGSRNRGSPDEKNIARLDGNHTRIETRHSLSLRKARSTKGARTSTIGPKKIVQTGILLALTALSAAGLVLYCYKPIYAAIGLQDKTRYLEEHAPDYQMVEAINRSLARPEKGEKTLLFTPHLHYLNIPVLNGDPAASFEVDPDRPKTAGNWKDFLTKNDIGYVLQSTEYPSSIREPVEAMEKMVN